jgi:phosphoribosylformylglycinamidine synthase
MSEKLSHIFDAVFSNEEKFVIGVCNGCQILINYGLFGEDIAITHNDSGKFESRWLPVDVSNSETQINSRVGIWVAHGEGKLQIPAAKSHQVFAKYISGDYPLNPNGSDFNAIGVASLTHKHLAIMPHPERSIFKWQCEYIPDELKHATANHPYTPWILLFKNLLDKNCKKISI